MNYSMMISLEGIVPLKKAPKGASKASKKKIMEENFHELRHGKTFAKTQGKFGKKKADAQMVAIEMANLRKAKSKKRKKK